MCKEANTTRNLVGQLNALIAEMEALEDQGELFDTLMDLKIFFDPGNSRPVVPRKSNPFFVVSSDFCFELRVTLSQHRRLIVELKALGQRGDALRALEALREIVTHNVVKLRVLKQLVVCTRVGIPLKAGYVFDMEDKEYSFFVLVFWIRCREYVFVMMF
ncbi:hypothetical protein Tco_1404178 [Tanacetum coccineum]